MHTANPGGYSHIPSTLSEGGGEIQDTTTELVQPRDLRVPRTQSSGSRLGYREAQSALEAESTHGFFQDLLGTESGWSMWESDEK